MGGGGARHAVKAGRRVRGNGALTGGLGGWRWGA